MIDRAGADAVAAAGDSNRNAIRNNKKPRDIIRKYSLAETGGTLAGPWREPGGLWRTLAAPWRHPGGPWRSLVDHGGTLTECNKFLRTPKILGGTWRDPGDTLANHGGTLTDSGGTLTDSGGSLADSGGPWRDAGGT